MTQTEFRDIDRKLQRRLLWRLLLWILYILPLLGALNLVSRLSAHRDLYLLGNIFVYGVSLLFLIKFILLGPKADSQKFGAICPKCGKSLYSGRGVRNGCCPCCGYQLWTIKSNSPTMTLDTFKSKIKKMHRYEIISIFALCLGVFLAGIPCDFLADRAARVGFDSTCFFVVAISAPIIAAVIFFGCAYIPKKGMRKLDLGCPSCGSSLVGKQGARLIIKTGCCRVCGDQVIDMRDAALQKNAVSS